MTNLFVFETKDVGLEGGGYGVSLSSFSSDLGSKVMPVRPSSGVKERR